MTQSLRINEKEYLPSAELAKKFDYTSDYISKLARDEKVLGTRVGRQWFIEPESLRLYLLQLGVEKRVNQENLSRLRKVERLEKSPAVKVEQIEKKSVIAAGQSLVVVMCGLLIGLMTWSVNEYELQLSDLAYGAHAVATEVGDSVFYGPTIFRNAATLGTPSVANPLVGVSSNQADLVAGPQFANGLYATFPKAATSSVVVTDEDSILASEDSASLLNAADLPFSDEVLVDEGTDGLTVRPVFRDSIGNAYELSVIPVLSEIVP